MSKYIRLNFYKVEYPHLSGNLGISWESYLECGGPFEIGLELAFFNVTLELGKQFEDIKEEI